ncbi:hypothetical protein ACVWZZ_001388 [Bradyrhizobium sp. LM6.10]
MNSVQRSVLFSAVDRYAGLVLFLVSTAVLSRLLTPSEFGVFAVVNALTAVIAAAFQEFGGANYLIQKRELSRGTVRTAFTITWAISLAVALILLASADIISQLFGQDGLRRGIEVSALNLLLLPVSGTLAALFRRDMQFGTLAICNFASNITIALVSIGLAVMHFSYMAPIWGGVAGSVVLAAMLLSSYRDFGVLRPSLSEYRDVLEFGLFSSGVSAINIFYNLAPQLFLAKILDFTAVGLYSRAINLTQVFDRLVTQVLNPIIMPAFVTRRAAGADLKGVYLDAVQLLSARTVAIPHFHSDYGKADRFAVAGGSMAGGSAVSAHPLPCKFGAVRCVPDISRIRGSWARARRACLVFHLVATIAPCPLGSVLFWRGGSCSVRLADVAISSSSGDILPQSASGPAAGRVWPCPAEERCRHVGDRFGHSHLCGVDRGGNS